MSEQYVPGPKARKIDKFDVSTLIKPAFDSNLLLVDFELEGLRVSGPWLRRVAARFGNEIPVMIDPSIDARAITAKTLERDGDRQFIRPSVIFAEDPLKKFDRSHQALVVHEATHALFDWLNVAPKDKYLNESAAYIAEALYFQLQGDSIIRDWEARNYEIMEMDFLEDKYTSKAKIMDEADKVVVAHNLHQPLERRGVTRLTKSDCESLYQAIKSSKAYAPA